MTYSFQEAFYILMIWYVLPLAIALAIITRVKIIFGKAKTIDKTPLDLPHGNSKLASDKDLSLLDLKSDDCSIPVGRVLTKFNGKGGDLFNRINNAHAGKIIKYNPIHSFCFAPTGSGKGAGIIVPTLLDYKGPVVVLDPKKGENYHITAKYRQSLGREVLALDPNNYTQKPSITFNIFDFISDEPSQKNKDIIMFANALCPTDRTTNEVHSYFKISSQSILACLIMHVTTFKSEERNLNTVSDLLNSNRDKFYSVMKTIFENKELCKGIASRYASRIMGTDPRELSGVMGNAVIALKFLDIPCYSDLIKTTNFSFKDVFNDKADIFICLPIEEMEDGGIGTSFVRLFISLFVDEVLKTKNLPKKNILLLIDEMATIGRISRMSSILKATRSYGLRLFGVAQTLPSLKEIYGDLIAEIRNSSLLIFFGFKDKEDTEFISSRLGTTTNFTKSTNTGKSINDSNSNKSSGETISAIKSDLLDYDSVTELCNDHHFVFTKDTRPAVLRKIIYYKDSAYDGKHSPNPFENKEREK